MKRIILFLFFSGILGIAGTENSAGQFLGNPIDFSGRGTFFLGLEGNYGVSEWEMVSLTSKGALARLGFGIDNGFDVYLIGGERDFLLTERILQLKDVSFPFDYVAGAGLRLRVFESKSQIFSLNTLADVLYFNPQASFDTPVAGNSSGKIQRSFIMLEGMIPQAGFSTVVSQSHLSAFVGVLARYNRYKTNRRVWAISTGSAVIIRDEFSIQESPVQMVLSLGLEFKLPYNYRIGFEVQNSSLSDFSVMAGISQIGSP